MKDCWFFRSLLILAALQGLAGTWLVWLLLLRSPENRLLPLLTPRPDPSSSEIVDWERPGALAGSLRRAHFAVGEPLTVEDLVRGLLALESGAASPPLSPQERRALPALLVELRQQLDTLFQLQQQRLALEQ